eukprot:m.1365743 g.1365743  ORF g.1365743 m.1365743 type:complete len:53 (-) comp24947_c1_seq31:3804-3962(-)
MGAAVFVVTSCSSLFGRLLRRRARIVALARALHGKCVLMEGVTLQAAAQQHV